MTDYSRMSFDDLNAIILNEREKTSEEVLQWAISRGIENMEIYVWSLAKNYGIAINDSDLGEIINDMIDNVMKYFKICNESPNLKTYMVFTVRGKFLNYFRDRLNGIYFVSMDKSDDDTENKSESLEKYDSMKVMDTNIEEKIMVKEAFGKLKEECRKALYYRKVLDYSIQEIKSAMKLTLVTDENMRKKISLCLESLREIYMGGVENGGKNR